VPALYFLWSASWLWAVVFAGAAVLIALGPRFRAPELENVQVDETGVLRVDGDVKEQVQWNEIEEIKIITTDQGPYREDVFFALAASNGKGCLVPHDAAVRTKLLEELQARFPTLNDELVIEAMGSTSNKTFLVWKKASNAA